MLTEVQRPLFVTLVSSIALFAEAWCICEFYVGVRLSDDYLNMRAFEVGKSIARLADSGKLTLYGKHNIISGEEFESVWLTTVAGRKMYVIVDERQIVKGVVPFENTMMRGADEIGDLK